MGSGALLRCGDERGDVEAVDVDRFTILLVEDDELGRRLLAEVIRRQHHRALPVADARAALQAFEQHRPDIVLADLHLPDRSGLWLLRELRRVQGDLPVILITADPAPEPAAEALRLGALDYLHKPLDLDVLLLALQRAGERVKQARRAG